MRNIPRIHALVVVACMVGSYTGQDAAPAPVQEPTRPTVQQAIPGTELVFDLVEIPAGTLVWDDPATEEVETAAREVGPFLMMTTEATWDVFDAHVYRFDLPEDADKDADGLSRPTQPYISADRGYGHAGFPAVSVNWESAESFCAWLSTITGERFRLPTELEWEYACRAGTTTAYWFGDDPEDLREHAVYRSYSGLKTRKVATTPPNPWGLYDVHGNVAEWCTTSDGAHVLRGGSFEDRQDDVTATARKVPSRKWNASDPQLPKSKWWLADGPFAGFRVVRELPAQGETQGEER